MKTIRSHSAWMFGLIGALCLVTAAVVVADRQTEVPAPAAKHAQELSSVFRHISQQALPSIVSIETVGKAVKRTEMQLPFNDDSPFGEMFRNHPQFRELFKNNPRQEMPRSRGMGSGFIIDSSGVIMTNSHVVNDAEEVKVRLQDGREFIATEIATDPKTDVAIVRIENAGNLQAISMGNSDAMQIGDWVLAVGSPFGLELSVTAGIISAKSRGPGIAEREDFLQTDAAINPGNSGGPLLNMKGEVIGINTAISTRSGGYDGIGFTIPVNMARWVSRQLIEKGKVSRAYLGVAIQQVDNDLANQFGIQVGEGAIVSQVMPESPAADAKLQPGDVILELDGKKVRGTRNLQSIVEQLDIGTSYDMLIKRDGKKQTLNITFKEMPEKFSMSSATPKPTQPEETNEAEFKEIGVEVKELTEALAKQFGYEEDNGVLVNSVAADGPAYAAGLRTGDLIVKVGTTEVQTVEGFRTAVKENSSEKGLLLLVKNNRGSRFVVVETSK